MIHIECTLHGSLEDCVPIDLPDNKIELEFKHAPSVNQLLARLKLEPDYLQYALTQGHYIELEEWDQPIEGSEIQLWPRISGG